MIYLFACISPQCIKRSDCVRAFRAIQHDQNNFITFASESDYNFVIDKTDASLRTSKLAAMYDGENQTNQVQDEDDEDDNNSCSDQDENEQENTTSSAAAVTQGENNENNQTQKSRPQTMINTTSQEASSCFGALGFKPVLTEYLIDSCEEPQADTLFYVRQARRLAIE